jgi:uncharacterized protein (DUF2342 family)
MVARSNTRGTDSEAPPDGGPLAGLLLAWRRLVSATGHALTGAWAELGGSAVALAASAATRYVRDPAGTLAAADAPTRRRLKEAGAVALAIGVALSFAVPASFGGSTLQRFLAAGWTAGWALARLLVLRAVLGRGDAGAAEDAWGPALLPYALAVADPLGLVALGVSGWLTSAGLLARGVPRKRTRTAIAWAFGGQVAVEAAAWVARGGLVFLLAARL